MGIEKDKYTSKTEKRTSGTFNINITNNDPPIQQRSATGGGIELFRLA